MFKIRHSVVAIMLAAGTAQAGTLVQWTFDGATNPPDEIDSAVAPTLTPSTGTGSGTGLHASTASDWTTPAGNGTSDAFGVNNWSVSDYFQFTFSVDGFSNLTLDFDQTSSTNGPKDFKIQTDTGSGYTDLSGGAYSVQRNGVPPPLWVATTYQSGYHLSFLLPNGTSGLRLVVTDSVSESGAAIGPTGTSRLDTVTISGDPTPEPASIGLALLGLGGLFIGARRRIAE